MRDLCNIQTRKRGLQRNTLNPLFFFSLSARKKLDLPLLCFFFFFLLFFLFFFSSSFLLLLPLLLFLSSSSSSLPLAPLFLLFSSAMPLVLQYRFGLYMNNDERSYGSVGPIIVNREQGLEAGGVAKICYCSMSRDNTGALKSDSVISAV